MPQMLLIYFHYGNIHRLESVEISAQSIAKKEMNISVNMILKYVKMFMAKEMVEESFDYLTIWIKNKHNSHMRENLFKLRKKKTEFRLIVNSKGLFQLNVEIEKGSEKSLLKNFQASYENYDRLKSNIEKVIVECQKQKDSDEKCLRPIDIAYFFADPLVSVEKKSSNATKFKIAETDSEVSFQLEYDQFISMVKGEQFSRNFRIEVMAATETNIKNTLIQGASVLHFACHGQDNGCLDIEHQKQTGVLAKLTRDKFMSLLDNKTLPRVIIFNACFSYELARRVSEAKKIITIGYKGPASDRCCEIFTKKFYMGLFHDGRSVREIFNEIKKELTDDGKNLEGREFEIFPKQETSEEMRILSDPSVSSKEYVVRWNMLESLREKDCLGVKVEMHELIKLMTNEQRMSYIFIEGQKGSGKTNLIEKVGIYVLNRQRFTDRFTVDLKRENGHKAQTMLEMRLNFESQIFAERKRLLTKGKQQRTSCLFVFDHAQRILRYQYQQFTKYIEEELRDKLKYGKIVILTRKDSPYQLKEAKRYLNAIKHPKKPERIKIKDFTNFLSRYWPELKNQAEQKLNKSTPIIDLLKAVKSTKSPDQFQKLFKNIIARPQEPQQQVMEKQEVLKTLSRIESGTQSLLNGVHVQVIENHHLYISTILEEIAAINHKPNREHQKQGALTQGISQIVSQFKSFFQKAFLQHPDQCKEHFKQFARLSLKIAGLCYLADCDFQRHMLNCQKMHVMASVVLFQLSVKFERRESKKQEQIIATYSRNQFQELLKQYKLKVLLTLYTYYTECYFSISHMSLQSEEIKIKMSQKAEIVLSELYHVIQKKNNQHEIELKENFLKKYKQLNSIIQELQYMREYKHLNSQDHSVNRKLSGLESLNNENNQIEQSTEVIHARHKKIQQFWLFYNDFIKANESFNIFSKDSLTLMLLSLIKLINFSQSQLLHLQEKGQNFLKRGMHAYLQLYVNIMQWIHKNMIFARSQTSHSSYAIWLFLRTDSITVLFKKYFRMFVNVYFQVEKISQSLTKNYEIKIFSQLLEMCDLHKEIKMVSVKREIEMHKDQQFLSNYCCETYVALPLLKCKSMVDSEGNKINLKRYQTHFQHVQELFFSNLDRQIKHDTYLLSKDIFMNEHSSKSLIQLFILNCSKNLYSQTSQSIQCQSITGKDQTLLIQHIQVLPKAPVIIIFGFNVKYLIDTFRRLNKSSVLITFELDSKEHLSEKEFLMQPKEIGTTKQKKDALLSKQKRETLERYSSMLQISYSVLQFFYTSFCRHFFTVDHVFFEEQVRNSFHLAKAQALIKTKIRFQGRIRYADFNVNGKIDQKAEKEKREIQKLIKQTVDRVELIKENMTINSKPAYHFMYKQYKLENFAASLIELTRKKKRNNEMPCDIGCNRSICELLSTIDAATSSTNIVYAYKSREMLEHFVNTLLTKLRKCKKYDVEVDIQAPQTLDMLRSTSSSNWKSKASEKQTGEESIFSSKRVMVYIDLKEQDFWSQTKLQAAKIDVVIRLFFTRAIYSRFPEGVIKEDISQVYQNQKIDFQLFFLDCKSRRLNSLPVNTSGKDSFRKVMNKIPMSFHQISQEIQNINH